MRRRAFLLSAFGASALGASAVSALSTTMTSCGGRRGSHGAPWDDILSRLPAGLAAHVDTPAHEVQAIYTRIDRDRDQRPTLTAFPLQLAPDRWFTAASWVKLPAVLLTAERLTRLGADMQARIALAAPPASGNWDAGEPLEEPFERTVRRLLTVSENVPFNRLFEYLGPADLASGLQAHGYPPAWIIARLGSQDFDAHRSVVASTVIGRDGRVIERRESRTVTELAGFPGASAIKGRGWNTNDGQFVAGPHDFSRTNYIPLPTMHEMLTALICPEAVPPQRAWQVAPAMRRSLLTELARWPRESSDPLYRDPEHVDGFAKYFIVGDRRERAPDGLRLFSKSGQAYGYLQDCAYITDREAGVECLLTATIHANADGVYNDDRYEYDQVSIPFLAALGRAVLEHERARPRQVRPDFAGLPTQWN